jgi:hypothetical protein
MCVVCVCVCVAKIKNYNLEFLQKNLDKGDFSSPSPENKNKTEATNVTWSFPCIFQKQLVQQVTRHHT